MSTKLQTLADLWPLFGVYRMLSPPELQTLAVLWPLFGVYIKVAIKLLTMAVLWPHHSKSSFHHKTANPGSFVATLWNLHQSGNKTANHCSCIATTFKIIFSPQNCKPWQFYGHFSESTKSGHKTANPSSSMATFRCL